MQASCVQYRLVVREVSSLQILQLYTCLDQIQHVEWSADSLFILCAMYKRGLVQVCRRHCLRSEPEEGLFSALLLRRKGSAPQSRLPLKTVVLS